MKTKLWPSAVLCALLATTTNHAHAEAIRSGTFALGAERITGVFHADEKDPGNSQGHTAFALFGNSADSPLAGAWQLPRVGFDVFVVNGLSLGGSFVVLTRSTEGGGDATDIIFAPRVGYAYMFGRVVGIWPRGGLSYWHESGSGNFEAHSFAFDVDVPLIFACTHSFAITLGPLLDVGFSGKRQDADTSFVQFGLSAGIVGFL
jgi:hypothetical protein